MVSCLLSNVSELIIRNSIENYYEPFCGGLNILDKIICNNLYANDIDSDLIAFYQYIKDGGEPVEDVSRDEYIAAKNNSDQYPAHYIGNIKYMASFGGKPWGGYSGIDKRKKIEKTMYQSTLRNFFKQIPIIKKTIFTTGDYSNIEYKKNSMIVCDPPYKGTTPYQGIKFEYERFYSWLREISKNNFVILCEYTAPEDFMCFKEIQVKKTLKADDNVTNVKDCLWCCEGLFKDYLEKIGGIK